MRIKKKTRTKVYVLIFIVFFLLVTVPAVAQDNSGRDILVRTSASITGIELWWDSLWESTFVTPSVEGGTSNLSLYTFVNPVRFILMIAVVFWIFSYGTKIAESKGGMPGMEVTFNLLLPLILAMLFLGNQAENSRILAYGLREVINSWSNQALELTLLDVNVRSAVQDLLVTEEAKQEVVKRLEVCEALPQPEVAIPTPNRPIPTTTTDVLPLPPPPGGEPLPVPGGGVPTGDAFTAAFTAQEEAGETVTLTTEQRQVYDYLECLERLSDYAGNQLDRTDSIDCFGAVCKASQIFLQAIGVELDGRSEEEINRRLEERPTTEFGDVAPEISYVSSFLQPGSSLLYFTQWMSVSGLEMALFLNALFAPLFIAVSLIPNRQNLFAVWLIETMTIGMAKLAYIIVVGLVAVQKVSGANLQTLSDDSFIMTLGIFAPAVAFAVVTVGGLAAASSYRNQAVGTVGAIGSVVTGAFASLSFAISRSSDKNR